jgi:hypothetical protein
MLNKDLKSYDWTEPRAKPNFDFYGQLGPKI